MQQTTKQPPAPKTKLDSVTLVCTDKCTHLHELQNLRAEKIQMLKQFCAYMILGNVVYDNLHINTIYIKQTRKTITARRVIAERHPSREVLDVEPPLSGWVHPAYLARLPNNQKQHTTTTKQQTINKIDNTPNNTNND